MNVILLDDESLALDYLEKQLLKIEDVYIVGKYVDPIFGKKCILHENVDVIFLDIHLPEINGIELAEQLLESKPNLHIVFVTAYDEYAIKAFELNALDYLMKPVGVERLLKTIQRIKETSRESTNELPSPIQTIHMSLFQQLSIQSGGYLFTPIRWRTTKAEELFLYLLQHRGQPVRKSAIIDLLWPDYELSKANSQMYTTVYHIRKTLERLRTNLVLSNVMDGYILTLKNVVVDVDEWERNILARAPIKEDTIEEYEKHMFLYKGDFLESFDYLWLETERQRLRQIWLRISFQMAELYFSNHQYEKAAEKYLEICTRHPLEEEAHFALMKVYVSLGNYSAVHLRFQMLTRVLEEELMVQPSPSITEWYQEWNEEKEDKQYGG